MAVAGTVTVDLEARVARLESDMGRAAQIMDRSMKKIQMTVSSAMEAVAGYFTVGAIVDWAEHLIDAADAMGKFAQKTGVSVETLAAWSKEAEKAGVDTEALSKGMQAFAMKTDAALNGDKGAAAALQRIGLSLTDLKNLSTGQQLEKVANTFAKYKDGASKAAAAQDAFGKTGTAMIPWLNQGGQAMADAEKHAAELGYTMSAETAKAAGEFNDKLADMKTAAEGTGQKILSSLLPALNTVADKILEIAKSDFWKKQTEEFQQDMEDATQSWEEFFRYLGAGLVTVQMLVEKAGEYLKTSWQDQAQNFVYVWDVAVNAVKTLWKGMIDGLASQASSLPMGVGDKWADSLRQYADGIQTETGLEQKFLADREARHQASANKMLEYDVKWRTALEKYMYPDVPPVQMPVRPDADKRKDFPHGTDTAGIDKAQKALDSLQSTVDNFYAKNLETGDKVQDQQAQSLRQLAQVGAAAIDAGADVHKVQALVADGSEQIAKAAQKQRDDENRAFDDYVAQQETKLKYQKEDYALQAASVGMSDKEIKAAQDQLAIDRELAQAIEELNKARDKKTISQEEYDRRVATDNRLALEQTQALHDAQAQQAANQADYMLGAQRAMKNFMDEAADVATQTGQIMTNAFSSFTDAFANMLTTGKADFKSFAISVLSDLAKMETRIAMSKILSTFLGGSSLPSGSQGAANDYIDSVLNARGNVFASASNISALSGGVYNQPTFFAKGGNVLGEAGYEGVLPLARNSQGKLGVMAQGSGGGNSVSVVVNIDNSGAASTNTTSDDDKMRQMGSLIASKVKEVITSEQRPGGMLWRQAHA